MSKEYVIQKLNDLSEMIDTLSDEELKSLTKYAKIKDPGAYDFLCENVLGLKPATDSEELDIGSPEFLRQT